MAQGVIVLKLGIFERAMLFCSRVPTYVAAVGKKCTRCVYSKKGFRFQKEDNFTSANMFFYDVK